tara:strand:+ start:563 stop:745 length:183 start_codon:yes stop_codon:yes gene_type:complete
MKTLIKNLKAELKLREKQLKNADNFGLNKDSLRGQVYALNTAIIFAVEGVDSNTIKRYGK